MGCIELYSGWKPLPGPTLRCYCYSESAVVFNLVAALNTTTSSNSASMERWPGRPRHPGSEPDLEQSAKNPARIPKVMVLTSNCWQDLVAVPVPHAEK